MLIKPFEIERNPPTNALLKKKASKEITENHQIGIVKIWKAFNKMHTEILEIVIRSLKFTSCPLGK